VAKTRTTFSTKREAKTNRDLLTRIFSRSTVATYNFSIADWFIKLLALVVIG